LRSLTLELARVRGSRQIPAPDKQRRQDNEHAAEATTASDLTTLALFGHGTAACAASDPE
jgi:hypothetical protein